MSEEHIKNALGDYKHVKIGSHEGKKVVTKEIRSGEQEFYTLHPSLDFVLYPQKVEDGKATFEFLDAGTIEGKPKHLWEQAVTSIATYNSLTVPKVKEIPVAKKEQYLARLTETLSLAGENGVKLSKEGIDFMRQKLDELDFNSITHDDLIAPNVMVSNGEIKFIDWEHVRIDFNECDIGRFLGDLYWDNPKFQKTYYPYEWHDDLVRAYLNQMKKLNKSYNVQEGAQRVKFSELWNYLGPIYRVMADKEDLNGAWLKTNVESFNSLSKTNPDSWIEGDQK